MNTYIGIDLGTSSVKLMLVGGEGEILSQVTENYDVSFPQAGWSEQSPCNWLSGVSAGMQRLLDGQNKNTVQGISFGGQMHGLVVLDKNNDVIRPCILWNDGRTAKQTEYLNTVVGHKRLQALTGNIAFAGFTAPKLLWMRENEPENFGKIHKIMLPKDYLAFKLSGAFVSDFSDAAGTLLLDVKNRTWSKEMCEICSVDETLLPRLCESYEVVGNLLPEYARQWGLPQDVKIIIGAGDNAAAAIGCGIVKDGNCNISLGTSGTVFVASNRFQTGDAVHSFCHASGKYHILACILSAASCRKWWLEEILNDKDYDADEKAMADADTTGLYFLPYLAGERSPHNDTKIRGAFLGLSADTQKAQMSRAVIEGVCFAIRDCVETARNAGIEITRATVCGGGAKSTVWRQTLSDILNIPLDIPLTEQGPAYGAAILAMVGCGEYPSVEGATEKLIKIKDTVYPQSKRVEYYEKKYRIFKNIYPCLKTLDLNG